MNTLLTVCTILAGIGGAFAVGRFFVALYQARHDKKSLELQKKQVEEDDKTSEDERD